MFRLIKTIDGSGEVIEDRLMMKDNEAGYRGEGVVVTANRLTKAGATAKPTYILAMDTAAGTNVNTMYHKVREENIYEVDITGTGTITAGLTTGCLDSAGTGLDAATQVGGAISVTWADNTKKKAHVRF